MTSPAPTDTAPAPTGSRWESAWLALLLAKDVLSTPLHLVAFLFTGRRQKRRLLEELRKAAR